MEGIKNIMFDLGGVLVNLNREACIEAYEKIGFTDIRSYLGDYGQKGPFKELEEGNISVAEFYDQLRKLTNQAPDEEIANAFKAFLVDFPISKLKMLRDLKQRGYKMLLLSNTNEILFPFICETFFRQEGYSIDSYFDQLFLSYEIGAIKPDPRVFQHVIEQGGINPEETLFIDDSEENLNSAAQVGFETYLALPYTEFSGIFKLEKEEAVY